MAALARALSRFSPKITFHQSPHRSFSNTSAKQTRKWLLSALGCTTGFGLVLLTSYNLKSFNNVYAFRSKKKEDENHVGKEVKLTSRERRFLKFASVRYDGQIYMTPQDFLDSFLETEPEPREIRYELSTKNLEGIKKSTPSLNKGSKRMFRDIKEKGIISYTEYLFLLSILMKPLSGFRIAFNMFDTDGNERVDKNEFLVLQMLMTKRKPPSSIEKSDMEKVFSHAWKDKRGVPDDSDMLTFHGSTTEDYVDDEQGLQRRHSVDTTLTVHFFGEKGNRELHYEGFRKFMDDLQTEVLELEFHSYSKGHDKISEIDFAKILLRYTYCHTDTYDKYLERLLLRLKQFQGITFEEFKVFCQFLNNLEDFMIAMRMYTLADHPISKEEFHRAAMICTGTSLSRHLVDTVFAIFDDDGDGQLSYREFIAIMKDRLHRGFKMSVKTEGWESFRTCVRQEIKTPT